MMSGKTIFPIRGRNTAPRPRGEAGLSIGVIRGRRFPGTSLSRSRRMVAKVKFLLLTSSTRLRAPRARNGIPSATTGGPGLERGGQSATFTAPSATVAAPGATFAGENPVRTAPVPAFTLPSRALVVPAATSAAPNVTSTGESSSGTAPAATFATYFPLAVPSRTTKPSSSLVTHHLSLSL